ncbi:peptidoglycan-binding protein [Streptomyces sp. ActVer]|uniref:peptidoglycan-binding protein n=1 Tax=Streptomyces sp. ActVer TaxID=3014558 RepID=UPI0022B36004|nr:peptidoglycan-binding protein [Streptomyces sp. ActVer]MCZ4507810.1 peptidoglycan-binding protein [Streptomyces sp. ActVer]
MKRLGSRRQLGALVGAVVLVGAGGWFAGTQVRSPADAAASHRAPKAGPVTVEVERRSLTATVVATGTVAFTSPRPLSLAGSVGTGAVTSPAGEGAEQRVTKAPVAGTKVKEGDVLMTVNGRPVLALAGSVPMYRAMGPGATGDDVKQLQKALRRLGFDPGSAGGTFGRATATAVTNWYRNKGYEAQQPSAEDQQQLGQLQQAVSSAQEALLTTRGGNAGEDADTGDGSGTGAGTGTGGKANTGTETGAGTGAKTGTETSAGTRTDAQSSTDQQVQAIRLRSAQKSLDMANSALSSFQATYGTKVPAGEVVFFPELPVRLDKVTVKTGDAPSGPVGTVTGSELLVEAAVPGEDAELLRRGMPVEVTTTGGEKVKGKVEAIGSAAASSGTTGGDGEAATGAASEGSGADASDAPGGAADANAADTSGTDGAAGAGTPGPVQLRISIPDPGPLAGQAEASVKVTIGVGASDGKVLTVPLAAIRTSADGKARVQVERDGGVRDVSVTVGLSAAGLVEVKPADGTLEQGDKVVVGK